MSKEDKYQVGERMTREELRVTGEELKDEYITGQKPIDSIAKGRIVPVAHTLMKGESPKDFLLGARLYESIGRGREIIPRLERAAEKADEQGLMTARYSLGVVRFVHRNAKSRGVEGRLSIFTLSIIAGLALSISSLSTTGYAVSNLPKTGQGLGGIILFLVGLAGMFFSLRK